MWSLLGRWSIQVVFSTNLTNKYIHWKNPAGNLTSSSVIKFVFFLRFSQTDTFAGSIYMKICNMSILTIWMRHFHMPTDTKYILNVWRQSKGEGYCMVCICFATLATGIFSMGVQPPFTIATLWKCWTMMLRACFFMSVAWMRSAASKICKKPRKADEAKLPCFHHESNSLRTKIMK